MIATYAMNEGRLGPASGDVPLSGALWIDLFVPTREEETAVEAQIGLDLPTREEMDEIEHSSRLYTDGSAAYMTATIPAKTEGDDPELLPVTFVLTHERLVTIRYHEPSAFRVFASRCEKGVAMNGGSEDVILALLEAIVDREADVLERAGRDIDVISRHVFRRRVSRPTQPGEFQKTLEEIGRKGDLVSNIRDSLASLDRMSGYLSQVLATKGSADRGIREQVKTLSRDIRSIADHADALAQKITFLLDATLGMISIEQNATIKIFSVVAVIFLPPTLIASIYGMNYEYMPELSWPLGYPFALLLMVVSAILPFLFFKRRGWL